MMLQHGLCQSHPTSFSGAFFLQARVKVAKKLTGPKPPEVFLNVLMQSCGNVTQSWAGQSHPNYFLQLLWQSSVKDT